MSGVPPSPLSITIAGPAASKSWTIGSTSIAGDLLRARERNAVTAGFAVDADADLHLVLGQVERRLAGRGHGAAGERDAHRAAVRVDPFCASATTASRS